MRIHVNLVGYFTISGEFPVSVCVHHVCFPYVNRGFVRWDLKSQALLSDRQVNERLFYFFKKIQHLELTCLSTEDRLKSARHKSTFAERLETGGNS